MKWFFVEGTIKHASLMNDAILQEHMKYSGKAMEEGKIVMSGLKEDMSGGIFLMKAESEEKVMEYLNQEPLKVNGIQEYKVTPFEPHYISDQIRD